MQRTSMRRDGLDLKTTEYRVAQLLAWGTRQLEQADIPSERLDAEVLLAEALGCSRAQLLARMRQNAPKSAISRFVSFIERRKTREPIAYILGEQAFYGREFIVNEHVLIPRPETEELVERVLYALAHRYDPIDKTPPTFILPSAYAFPSTPLRVADIGTGSGAIAVTLAAEVPTLQLSAVDISAKAVDVARQNAKRHGVASQIAFYQGSLLLPLFGMPSFDLIVANLPYVGTSEMALMDPDVKAYEPHQALFAGPQGLDLFQPFFQQLSESQLLQPNGTVLLEIGFAQGPALLQLANSYFPTAKKIALYQDLAHHDRFIELRL